MKRSPRAFCATVFELEERALQAKLTLTVPPPPPSTSNGVGFGVYWSNSSNVFTQEVSQQSSVATVILSHNTLTGDGEPPLLQVQVTTDPSSPYVGVNIGAVNQTVTFAPGQLFAVLTVPIIAGAPNPGEVDVNLTMTPIDPSPSQDLNISVPVDTLRILASDASIPPAIVATDGTPQGIKLIFNKPMDPVQASNVKNYVVYSQTVQGSDFELARKLARDDTRAPEVRRVRRRNEHGDPHSHATPYLGRWCQRDPGTPGACGGRPERRHGCSARARGPRGTTHRPNHDSRKVPPQRE